MSFDISQLAELVSWFESVYACVFECVTLESMYMLIWLREIQLFKL